MCRIDISVISRSCKLAVDVQPDVHWQMYRILPLYNAYGLVHAFAVAVDHNVKPLRKHSHIYTRLPYPKPELSAHKCLHEVPPAEVLISNDGYLSVVAVWPGGIYNGRYRPPVQNSSSIPFCTPGCAALLAVGADCPTRTSFC